MNARKILLATCWIVLIGLNVVVFSVPIVSEPYTTLNPDRYQIEVVTDLAAEALSGIPNEDLRVLIRSDDLAFVPLISIGAVNLVGLFVLFTLGQAYRRTP